MSTANVSAPMGRFAVTAIVALAGASPCAAALPLHPATPRPAGVSARALPVDSVRRYSSTLVEVDRVRGGEAGEALRAAGGRLLDPELGVWRLPTATARLLLPRLERRALVRSVTPDLPVGGGPSRQRRLFGQFTDPLASTEWWPSHIGVAEWTAPGPGVPLTMIDSGVDLTHEEFAGRPHTVALNAQRFSAGEEELHGTATASVAAAPLNGKGVVGIYPQAQLQVYDASPAGQLTVGDEIAGLAAARRSGAGVVNLSLGGFDQIPIEEHAILNAFGAGLLIVASAGNDRQDGSSPSYPATFAHVLTVGATDEDDRVTAFSSRSAAMDLAAPGQDITVAIPTLFNAAGYSSVDGTSFSAPLVAGAAAAVWTLRPKLTNTQMFEIMRRSARDLGKRGWDVDSGYGLLNVPAALGRRAPAADPQEPNEDIYLIRPNGLTRAGKPPLTRQHRPRAALKARLERREDPEDVYRVWLPAKGKVVVTVRATANVTLEVWGQRTTTVLERGLTARRDLLGVSAHAGKRFERITLKGRGTGQFVYADVFLPKSAVQASYTVSVAPAAR